MQLTKVFARDPTLNLNAATSTSTSNASSATVPKASAAAASRSVDEDGEGEEQEAAAGAGYTVKTSRSYHLQNEEQTEVEAAQQVLGYRFGSSIIPFSDDDRANMQYSCNKCFQLLGFTAARNVRLNTHHLSYRSRMRVAYRQCCIPVYSSTVLYHYSLGVDLPLMNLL